MRVDVTKYGIWTDLFRKEMVGVRGFELRPLRPERRALPLRYTPTEIAF